MASDTVRGSSAKYDAGAQVTKEEFICLHRNENLFATSAWDEAKDSAFLTARRSSANGSKIFGPLSPRVPYAQCHKGDRYYSSSMADSPVEMLR